MKSTFGNLNWKDVLKGAFLAGVATLFTAAIQLLQAGPVEWTMAFWSPTLTATAITFLSYILKNALTNSNDQLLKKEQ